MAKEFKEMVTTLTEEQLAAPATMGDVIEALTAVDEMSEVMIELNFMLEEQRTWSLCTISAVIDYISGYLKVIAEDLGEKYEHKEFLKGFEELLKERLKPYNEMVEEHQNVLKTL